MIKRTITYAVLALLTLGFAGCQQEDDFTPQGGVYEQVLRIATRGTIGGETSETFTEDFTLELWNTIDATKLETHSMTYTDGTGWNIVKTSILPAHAFAYKGGEVKDISYTDKWIYTVNLQAVQTTPELLSDADVMIATGEASGDKPLDLHFEHLFAKVTFNYLLASEFEVDDDITACTVKGTTEVNACVDNDNWTITAIVAPGTYTPGNDFASITVSQNSPLTVKVPEDGLVFEAGKHYTFELKVGKDVISLTPTITDTDFPGGWDNDSEVDLN